MTVEDSAARAYATIPLDQVAMFADKGACVVRGLLNATEIGWLRDGIEQNLADPGPRALVVSPAADTGLFVEDFCNWQRIEGYRRVLQESPIAAAAGILMGSDTVRIHHDHLLVKEPRTQRRTPWHHDQPFYNIDGSQTCSVWLPVDPVPIESTLELLAGSHREGWKMPRSFRDEQAKWFPEGTFAEVPDIDRDRDVHEILAWAMEPGDAVFFNMLTIHGAGGAGPGRRRVVSFRLIGDDVVHAPRRWPTSPDFPGLTDTLPSGAPLDHPLFPILCQRGVLVG